LLHSFPTRRSSDLSSACNSIWDFQLIEGPKINDEQGPSVLSIVDANFSGYIPKETIRGIDTYQARGTKSPFISFSWDMTIAGAMQSSIMIKKMSGRIRKTTIEKTNKLMTPIVLGMCSFIKESREIFSCCFSSTSLCSSKSA
jgi:hypothetical protein